MLPISYKMRRCRAECERLIAQLEQWGYVLEDAKGSDKSLYEAAGTVTREFASQMGDRGTRYVTLADDAYEILKGMRKVCSGEITAEKANEYIRKSINELKAIRDGLSTFVFDKEDTK